MRAHKEVDDTQRLYRRHLRAQGYSPHTVRAKLEVVACVAAAAGVAPREITVDHVEAYLERPLSAWTRRKYLEHLRGFAAWAGIADPTAGLRPPRPPRGVPKPVNEVNLELLLATAPVRTRAFIVLGAFAGLRSFEIAKVRADDLEIGPEGWALRVHGKGDRTDVLPVPPVVVRELRQWRRAAPDGLLWPGVTARAVQEAVRRSAARVGLRTSCHQLRHRYGTALYAESHDLLLVQQLMRHESPTSTAGYALVASHLGAQLVSRLPGAA